MRCVAEGVGCAGDEDELAVDHLVGPWGGDDELASLGGWGEAEGEIG